MPELQLRILRNFGKAEAKLRICGPLYTSIYNKLHTDATPKFTKSSDLVTVIIRVEHSAQAFTLQSIKKNSLVQLQQERVFLSLRPNKTRVILKMSNLGSIAHVKGLYKCIIGSNKY